MATQIDKIGPGALSGEIKFSDLRKYFLKLNKRSNFSDSDTFAAETGSVSASQLLRDTSGSDPIVPDATENASVSASVDWTISTMRNTVKYYYIKQSGIDEEYNISAQSWNSNLNKTIYKIAYLDGTMGSTDPTSPAAKIGADAKNLELNVSGMIYGAAGNGASSLPSGDNDGGQGGTALLITAPASSLTMSNILVRVSSISSNIFGGGGGGGSGGIGGEGGDGADGEYGGAHCTPYSECHHTTHNPGPGHHHGHHFCHYGLAHCTPFSGESPGGEGGEGGSAGSGGAGMGYDPNDPAGSQEGTPIGTGGEGGEGSQGSDGPAPVGNSGPGGDAGDGGDGGDGSSWGESGSPGADGSPGDPGDGTSATPSTPGSPGEGGGSSGAGGLGGYSIQSSSTSFNYTGFINTSGSNITIRGSIIGGTLV